MREFRLKSFEYFKECGEPNFGPKLKIDYDSITYYKKRDEALTNDWEKISCAIRNEFKDLGVIDAERKYLDGMGAQYDSEVIYHNMIKELESKNVIFMDTDSALKKYPELFKRYFNTLVRYDENKFTALNGAVWSGGTFIYIPKNTKLDRPLQSYFRINSKNMGQFERTLIIVDDNSELHYIEGCTAPTYTEDALHAAVVEIFVGKNAKCRYSTIQNWSNNIVNLVTKRTLVDDGGHMEWIDGNVGSGLNMKYPCCVLKGKGSKGTCISIAFASEGQLQDAGAKMIHLGENSTSTIISKSICRSGGKVNYRGLVSCGKKALGARAHVECDTLILDDKSTSDTIPSNVGKNGDMYIEHEATVSKVNEEELFYLMSRGLTEAEATEMIVMGFIEPFSRELPMEYAVELNRLIKLEMVDSIG
jgi:Fe-S cluster assembly protein SufB